MPRRTTSRVLAILAALAATVTLAACGSSSGGSTTATGTSTARQPGAGKPPITLGDKNFTEEFILGQLYAQALRAKGYTVDLKPNIGSSEIIYNAFQSGQIDVYPEYTGEIVSSIAHRDTRFRTQEAAYRAAKAFLKVHGATLLNRTPFFDTDALGVLTTYARQHHLKSIPDLGKLGGQAVIGAAPEFRTRTAGLIGLRTIYDLHQVRFKPLSIGLVYPALDSGRITVGDVFTTDPQLLSGRYTVLADPKNMFGFQNVAPVVKQSLLRKEGPTFARTLNAVSAKLTNKAMQQMNKAVALDKQDPASVAGRFLRANGLK